MKKIILVSFSLIILFLMNCNNKKEPITETQKENLSADSVLNEKKTAKNSIPYEGTYKGILPCVERDCRSLEVEIELRPSNGYIYSTKRLGLDKNFLSTTGVFRFEEDGNTIVLPEIHDTPNTYFIEEGKIIRLDRNGKKIKTVDSIKYILKKETLDRK